MSKEQGQLAAEEEVKTHQAEGEGEEEQKMPPDEELQPKPCLIVESEGEVWSPPDAQMPVQDAEETGMEEDDNGPEAHHSVSMMATRAEA